AATARVGADARYLELAADALGDLRPGVAQAALEVLLAPRPPGVLPAATTVELARLLASSRAEPNRGLVCEALAKAGPDGVAVLADRVAAAARGRDGELRAELAGALAMAGEQARAATPHLIVLCRRGYTWVVAAGRSWVPPDRRRRLAAVRALGAAGANGEEAIVALLGVLEDEHGPVRAAAAEALGRVATPEPAV